jgi:hypothetical protein
MEWLFWKDLFSRRYVELFVFMLHYFLTMSLFVLRSFLFNLLFRQEGPVVVVVDHFNGRLAIWRLRDGTVWKHIGSEGTKPGQFNNPVAIALTLSGALVVTDERRVQVLTVEGAMLCVLDPTAVVGVGQLGRYLYGVAVCPWTDEILVTDLINHRVVALMLNPNSEVPYFIFIFTMCYNILGGAGAPPPRAGEVEWVFFWGFCV